MENILVCIGHELIIEDVVKADRCTLYDSKDNKYLDFESGVWCTPLGHCHPEINSAIKNQIDLITHTGYCFVNPILETSAGAVLNIIGFKQGRCVYLCSGSEAVEFNLQVTRKISDKPLLLTMTDSYLASYGSANKKEENEWYLFDWLKCSGCKNIDHCDPRCERLTEIPFQKISGFVFEPGSSSGLVRFPPPSLIKNITEKIKEHNALIIVNEVTTGVGRTGKWFGYQHYDIEPDMVAIGKGIGNGYPVSIAAVSHHVLNLLCKKNFKYSQSHQNDPLGAAVANEVIKVIQRDNLIDQCRTKGMMFFQKIKALQNKFDVIKEVRGRGLMIAIEFNPGNGQFLAPVVQRKLLDKGIIIASRPGFEVLRIDPPLIVSEKELDFFIQCFEEVMKG